MSWTDIPGWFSFAHAYDEMVETAQDGDTIVEVGVAFGRSVAYLARKVIDSGKDITIYAVDPWLPRWDEHPKYPERLGWGGEHAGIVKELGGPFNSFLSMMITYAPEELERINVLRCTSLQAARIVNASKLHGILIDASHTYEDVREDIGVWGGLMSIVGRNAGAIIAGDDYHPVEFPGVVRAVHEHFTSGVEVRGTTWLKRL